MARMKGPKNYLFGRGLNKVMPCVHCKTELTFKQATIDHIKPLSKGGKLKDINNMQISCKRCNKARGNNESWKFSDLDKNRISQ